MNGLLPVINIGIADKGLTAMQEISNITLGLQTDDTIKVKINSVPGQMEVIGRGTIDVLVNRSSQKLPVIKVRDNRGSERWFLDSANNPIMVKHVTRNYTQTLSSITTNKTNTLRWIKGKKLITPNF